VDVVRRLFLFGVLGLHVPNPIILLILLVGALDTYRRWKAYRAGGPESRAYYACRRASGRWTLAVYLGLVALLVVGMDATYLDRDLDDV
jgi:hypothetical protein